MKHPTGDLEKKIRDLFRQNPARPVKTGDIPARLKIRGAEALKELRETLAQMVMDGTLIRKGKQFTLNEARLRGVITISKKQEGFVTVEGHDHEFYIAPHRLRTALNGDTVSIIPLQRKTSRRQFEAEVVRVEQRGRSRMVGIFRELEGQSFVIPDDPYMKRDFMVAEPDTMGAQDGQKVIVRLKDWTHEYLNPAGAVVQILGFPGDPGVDVLSVAMAHDIHYDFPAGVTEECGNIPAAIPEDEIERRLDLRDTLCVTIDPEDAKDFDDAVTLSELSSGHYLLGVHIADVSYYVREKTAIDGEAYKRGTSVYLVDRTIPMLPEKLSNDLCSLRPHSDRLTFSVLMEMDPQGNIMDYDICETIIHSRQRMTYEEVQSVIVGRPPDGMESRIIELIQRMHKLASILTKKRIREGSVDFDTPEAKFRLDEKGYPVECCRKERLDSHRLVEEFMLAANRSAARHIGTAKGLKRAHPFLYRVHDKPIAEKIINFTQLLNALGYPAHLPKNRENIAPSHFQALLSKIRGKKEQSLVEKVAIRTMAKAEYSPDNIGHFGLAFDYYTHFTSPIRRYPDLIVHRLLKEYDRGMTADRYRHWNEILQGLCAHCSEREQIAVDAERESVKLKQIEFMQQFVGQEFNGLISGVMGFGLFVEIPEFLIEGLVQVRDMQDDYYIYDEKQYRLTGRRTHRSYQLGDEVRIRVIRVNAQKNEIDMIIVNG